MKGGSMIVKAILLGTLIITSYRATPEQTKPGCKGRYHCETSIGENVNELGIAVSQDYLRSGRIHYGDVVYVSGIGYRIVFDAMSSRWNERMDIFVYTRAEEKKIGVRRAKVYLIQGEPTNELPGLSDK
jgi:3D (Asp-Asp-Asp) domain-containing protein